MFLGNPEREGGERERRKKDGRPRWPTEWGEEGNGNPLRAGEDGANTLSPGFPGEA